ncbi:MAG: hypothetical protein ABIA83_01320 [Patescibacteria group bacterium]
MTEKSMSTLPQEYPLDSQTVDALRVVADVILHFARSFAIFNNDVLVRQTVRNNVPYLVITCHRRDTGRIIGKGHEHINMMRAAANELYRHYDGGQIEVILPSEGTRHPLAMTQPDDQFPVVEYRPRPCLIRPACA